MPPVGVDNGGLEAGMGIASTALSGLTLGGLATGASIVGTGMQLVGWQLEARHYPKLAWNESCWRHRSGVQCR